MKLHSPWLTNLAIECACGKNPQRRLPGKWMSLPKSGQGSPKRSSFARADARFLHAGFHKIRISNLNRILVLFVSEKVPRRAISFAWPWSP